MKAKSYLVKDLRVMSSLLKKHVIILTIIFLSYIATYLLNVYLANLLTPRLYGDISIIFQVLIFSMPFALLGTEMTMMRYLPKYFAEKDYAKASGFIRWNVRLFIWATVAVLALGFITVCTSIIFEVLGFKKVLTHPAVFYSFWLIPLFSLIILLATLLQTLRRYYAASAFKGCAVTLLIIVNLMLFLSVFESTWIGDYRRPLSIVLCMALAYISIIGIEIYLLRKRLPKQLYEAKPEYKSKQWLSHSLEMLGSFAGVTILAALELIMLEIFGSGEAEVGHFAAIMVIASLLLVFGQAVDMLVNPLISSYIDKDKDHLQSIINMANVFKISLALIVSLLLMIFGRGLLSHFGKDFVKVYPALLVLLLGHFVGLCFRSASPLLLYSGHQRANLKASLSQVASLILLSIFLIPTYQIYGAVWSFALALSLFNIARTYYVRKYLQVKTFFFV